MTTRMLEHLLIGAFNRSRDRRERPRAAPDVAEEGTVLGEVIPSPSAQLSLPVPGARRELGREAGRAPVPQMVRLSSSERLRHLYVLGATGSGKTNLLLRLIESDLHNNRTLCVVDLRGDLVERVLLRLAHLAPAEEWRERLLLLDLRDGEFAVGFNPLAGEDDPYARSLHLLDVLRRGSESWGVQLEETLRNCLLALSEAGWTLLEIEPLLSNPGFRAQVLAQVTDSRVRSFFARYGALSPAQQLTWSLAVLNKVTPLLSAPPLRRVLGQRKGLPLREILDRRPGSVLLVSLAIDRFHEASRLIGGLFVSAFQNAVMARADKSEKERVPAFLYLDEFESMASERFEAIVAEGRRFGLGLTLSHQNLSQLPPRLKATVRNNVHAQMLFQTGALDAGELAQEVASEGQPRDAARSALLAQGVGEEYLVRRGEPSCRVRVPLCPDPRVSREQAGALRRAAAEDFARGVEEVEAELAGRERELEALRRTESLPSARPSALGRRGADRGAPVPPPPDAAPTAEELGPEAPASQPAAPPGPLIRHSKPHSFKSSKLGPRDSGGHGGG